MDMEVYFPGNKKVYANYKGFTVETDQPVGAGGDGTALAPFDFFLVSLGTCAGIFVLQFMQQRNLSTEGAGLAMRIAERDPESHLITKIQLEIKLPADFPEKYRDADHPHGGAVHGQAPPGSTARLRGLHHHRLTEAAAQACPRRVRGDAYAPPRRSPSYLGKRHPGRTVPPPEHPLLHLDHPEDYRGEGERHQDVPEVERLQLEQVL